MIVVNSIINISIIIIIIISTTIITIIIIIIVIIIVIIIIVIIIIVIIIIIIIIISTTTEIQNEKTEITTIKKINDEKNFTEVRRCLSVLIKKIITNDSKERMIARKLRKKKHEKLINEMGDSRFFNVNENNLNIDDNDNNHKDDDNYDNNDNNINCYDDNNHNNDSNNNDNNDNNNNKNRNNNNNNDDKNNKTTYSRINKKSNFDLSDWKNNKYCLNKNEIKSICWPFVIAGGNMKFCPYYRPYLEGKKDEEDVSEKKKISDPKTFSLNSCDIKTNLEGKSPVFCPLLHINRPIIEAPKQFRIFEIEDFFPIARFG